MQKKKLNLKEYAVWIMLVVLIAVFSLAVPNFATTGNMVTILRQVANIGILSVGMTFVLISGGIDLSIGNQMGLVGVISAMLMVQVIVIALGAFIMNKTYIGRQFYAVGSNEEAARLSGLRVQHVRVLGYVIAGFLAALSGIVLMSRVNSGQPMNGNGMEMDALIACVVGGVSVTGGEGKATGMIGGMLVMGILANGMAVAGMSEYLQMLVKGAVLVAVVAIDCVSRHQSLKSLLKK